MKRRKNRFGDITVHDKAYMGGILYGKKPLKQAQPIELVRNAAQLWDALVRPVAFVVDGIGRSLAALHAYWLRFTKRIPASPAIKSVYTMESGDTLQEPVTRRKAPAIICASIVATVLVAVGLATGLWSWAQQAFVRSAQTAQAPNGGIFLERTSVPEEPLNDLPGAAVEEGVQIQRAKPVVIETDNAVYFVPFSDGTVKDALDRANIACEQSDEVWPMLHEPLSAGLHIVLNTVDVRYETQVKAISFKTLTRDDDTLEKGKTKIQTAGKKGEKSVLVRIETRNGEEIAREEVKTEVLVQPVDQVVLKGSKQTKDAVSAFGLKNDTRQAKAPPKQAQIAQTVSVEATAYTHTGRRTATGTRPKVGTIAVNPAQIPYGTLLYVEGYGYGRAEDTGAFRHTDRFQIDLFMDTARECIKWGRKKSVTVYILK